MTYVDREPTTHDYTVPRWGRDVVFTPVHDGLEGKAVGWGFGIGEGDYLILRNGSGTTRYRVESIRYMADPLDMWSAALRFAPRMVAG